jgi:hypothetical protein
VVVVLLQAGLNNNGPTNPGRSGDGGAGASNLISGSATNYAGGGGGGAFCAAGSNGGLGGGGAGGAGTGSPNPNPSQNGVLGEANTGGGGGGAGTTGPSGGTGGAGGSGIVIVKQYGAGPYSIASGVWSLQCQYNFKKQGTWTPSATFGVDYLVVAGGGGRWTSLWWRWRCWRI